MRTQHMGNLVVGLLAVLVLVLLDAEGDKLLVEVLPPKVVELLGRQPLPGQCFEKRASKFSL